MTDYARTRNGGAHVAHAAHHRRLAENAAEDLVLLHAVLERDDRGAGADQRLDLPRRLLGVPQLDRDDDEIDRPDRLGIVAGLDLRQPDVAERALDRKPALAHRRQMRAAGEEGDVAAAGGKARAEIAADRSGPHDGDAHVELPANGSIGETGGRSARTLRLGGIADSNYSVANFARSRNGVPGMTFIPRRHADATLR